MGNDNRKIKRGNVVVKPPKKQEPQLSRDEIRKINKQKRMRREKIRKFVLTVSAVCVAVVVFLVLMVAFVFNIKTITVNGESKYPDKMIISKSGIAIGDALYLVNKDKTQALIEKELPYIKNVEIEQKFPNKLIINVAPAKEIAAIEQGGNYIIIDDICKVLTKSATMLSESNVVVSGVAVESAEEGSILQVKNKAKLHALADVLGAVSDSGIKKITEVNLNDVNNIRVKYDNRIVLLLGSVDDVTNKMSRAKAVVKAEDEKNPHVTGEVDLKSGERVIFSAIEETTKPAKEDKNDKKDKKN